MKMKAFAAGLFAAAGMAFAVTAPALADDANVSVAVDNEMVTFDQQPIIIEGHTMVPVRAVFEQAGAKVEWNQDTQTAIISKGDYYVTLKYGESVMYKNNEAIELESPSVMENDRILVPVRAIAEAMDFAVTWDGHHMLVLVSTNGKPYRPYAFRKTGFKTLEDASEFYTTDGSASVDLDNDGKAEEVVFNAADSMSALAEPILEINGLNYTYDLGQIGSAASIAVVDLDDEDGTKEIVVSTSGTPHTAYFYHYDNGVLKRVMNDDTTPASIDYIDKLLASGEGFLITDKAGMCFVDIMVAGSVYHYADNKVVLRPISSIESIFGRNLYHTYDDNMIYHAIYTESYTPGSYGDYTDTGMISASDIEQFKVINGYTDPNDPLYLELYVEFTDGKHAVLIPYSV